MYASDHPHNSTHGGDARLNWLGDDLAAPIGWDTARGLDRLPERVTSKDDAR
jgi:hypothetical protein